jgi:hypothetical protein
VGKVKTPPPLRNFQAQWESLAFGLFHEASFSIALLPTDTAIEPEEGLTWFAKLRTFAEPMASPDLQNHP